MAGDTAGTIDFERFRAMSNKTCVVAHITAWVDTMAARVMV